MGDSDKPKPTSSKTEQVDHTAEVSRKVDRIVSLQAAIDAVKKNTFRLVFSEEQNYEGHVAWSAEVVYSDVIEGALLELPSAQSEIVRCKDCTRYEKKRGCNLVEGLNIATENCFCNYGERRTDATTI